MKGMSIQAIAKACNGVIHGDNDSTREVMGVELDSRKLMEGYLFIATRGERVDGHSFISQAFEKGCLGVVCEKLPENIAGPCILVEDSFKALQDIAAYYRQQLSVKVVGITGSVGKTSTKEVIAGVLSEKYKVLKTEGNFNNEIGLPLTVLKIREEHEVAVLEMGINHFGEMHRLSCIAKPDVCVITNIGQCHLEFLIDRDGILRAKSEIFDFMNPDGVVCLNGDDDKLTTVKEVYGKEPIFFGTGENCDIIAKTVENLGLDGSKAYVEEKIKIKNRFNNTIYKNADESAGSYEIRVNIPGEHMVLNALAAIAVGRTLGLSTKQLTEGIAKTASVGGRSNIIRDDKLTVIDDCYNANPVSMKAAIELLETANTRKVALLGDMFELGENEEQLHFEVGSFLAEKKIDMAICVGTLAEEIYKAAKESNIKCVWFASKKELTENIHQLIENNDTVLIKASHGMGFSELVEICSSHTWL